MSLARWRPHPTGKLPGRYGTHAQNAKATRRGWGRGHQWFIHTLVCCPSRAETLTGRYFHNIKIDYVDVDLSVVGTNRSAGGCGDSRNGCMCVDDNKVNPSTFAVDLASVGYKVGMFGKYMSSIMKHYELNNEALTFM